MVSILRPNLLILGILLAFVTASPTASAWQLVNTGGVNVGKVDCEFSDSEAYCIVCGPEYDRYVTETETYYGILPDLIVGAKIYTEPITEPVDGKPGGYEVYWSMQCM